MEMMTIGIALHPAATILLANSPFRDGSDTSEHQLQYRYMQKRSPTGSDTYATFLACMSETASAVDALSRFTYGHTAALC